MCFGIGISVRCSAGRGLGYGKLYSSVIYACSSSREEIWPRNDPPDWCVVARGYAWDQMPEIGNSLFFLHRCGRHAPLWNPPSGVPLSGG